MSQSIAFDTAENTSSRRLVPTVWSRPSPPIRLDEVLGDGGSGENSACGPQPKVPAGGGSGGVSTRTGGHSVARAPCARSRRQRGFRRIRRPECQPDPTDRSPGRGELGPQGAPVAVEELTGDDDEVHSNMGSVLEHPESIERIEAWMAASIPNRDGERLHDRARSMEGPEVTELADFLDDLPW